MLRRLNFTVSLDCGLLDCFGLLGLFGGDFGSDEGNEGRLESGGGLLRFLGARCQGFYLCGAGALLIVVFGLLGWRVGFTGVERS